MNTNFSVIDVENYRIAFRGRRLPLCCKEYGNTKNLGSRMPRFIVAKGHGQAEKMAKLLDELEQGEPRYHLSKAS